MEPLSPYNDLPWELIVPALRGEQTPEEERGFQEWLDASADNRQHFLRLQEMWKEGLTDYVFYQQADEVKGWGALQGRMGEVRETLQEKVEQGKIVQGGFGQRVRSVRRWMAAAIIVVAAGAAWWYMTGKTGGIQYSTAAGQQRTVSLPDGSSIDLDAETQVRLTEGFNQTNRTMTLLSGRIRCAIVHQEKVPFIVDMEVADVKDIGTIFTVQRTKDSISVTVTEGRILFTDRKTGQAREVQAGGDITFYTADNHIKFIPSLKFDNARLADVIDALQSAFGRKIVLTDTTMGEKRLTVHLDGEPFEDALKTVCASLGLEYTVEGGNYILRNRK